MAHSFFEEVGGHDTFDRLTHGFYTRVAEDPVLRPMYEEEDLGPAERRLRLFLEQYFGGPGTYSAERGHPRLRMRHMPFAVTPDARDRWLRYMLASLDEIPENIIDDAHRAAMADYFQHAADMLVNSTDGTAPADNLMRSTPKETT